MTAPLVLSLFPGIGLLDHAFELEGFCVVRGPDLIWGGDIRRFYPPAGRFDGVIGGDPCQAFSALARLNKNAGQKYGDMVSEYRRVVAAAAPDWWIREQVPGAPEMEIDGYSVHRQIINNRWLGEVQERTRRIEFGSREGHRLAIQVAALEAIDYHQAVTSSLRAVPVKLGGSGRVKRTYTEDGKRHGPGIGPRASLALMLEHQGLPADFFTEHHAFTEGAKRQAIGNGVPIPMGRAVASAVRRALYPDLAAGAA